VTFLRSISCLFALLSCLAFSQKAWSYSWFPDVPADGSQVVVEDISRLPEACTKLIQQDLGGNQNSSSVKLKAWRVDRQRLVSIEYGVIQKITRIYECRSKSAKPIFFSVLDRSGKTTARQDLWRTEWDHTTHRLTSTVCNDATPFDCSRTSYILTDQEFWLEQIEASVEFNPFKVIWRAKAFESVQ
jgi:hypothetical protein